MYVDKSWEVIHIIGATNNIIITATCTRGRCSYRLSHSHKIGGGGGVRGLHQRTCHGRPFNSFQQEKHR